MAYIVQGMTLIPQQLNMSCWYASATMLIQWKMDQRQQSIGSLIPPELDAECQKIRDDNKGIANPQILKMAKRLGLESIPPMTPTVETIEGWLKQYGPLWVNGKTHIVVIAGIMWFPGLEYMFLVYNPAPVGVGKGARLLRERRCRQDNVGQIRGLGQENVLDHQPVERRQRCARVVQVGVGQSRIFAHHVHTANLARDRRVHHFDDGETGLRIELRAPQFFEAGL